MKKWIPILLAAFCFSGQMAQKPAAQPLPQTNVSHQVEPQAHEEEAVVGRKSAARKVVEGIGASNSTTQVERKSAAKKSMESEIN